MENLKLNNFKLPRWTPTEIEILQEALKEGDAAGKKRTEVYQEVAGVINRTSHAIDQRVYILKLRADKLAKVKKGDKPLITKHGALVIPEEPIIMQAPQNLKTGQKLIEQLLSSSFEIGPNTTITLTADELRIKF